MGGAGAGAHARPRTLAQPHPQASLHVHLSSLHIRRLQYDLDVRTVRPAAVRPLHSARGREALYSG